MQDDDSSQQANTQGVLQIQKSTEIAHSDDQSSALDDEEGEQDLEDFPSSDDDCMDEEGEDNFMDQDSEMGEDEHSEKEESSSEEEDQIKKKNQSGKKSLSKRVQEEQEIRLKEKKIKDNAS